MQAAHEKSVLRDYLRAQRNQLDSRTVSNLSKSIFLNCLKAINWDSINSLHTYLPIARYNEPDSWLLLKHIWNKYPEVITGVPLIINGRLVSATVNANTGFKLDKHGIPEPDHPQIDQSFQPDVIIVPLLGFDIGGHRLGYGKGHYDKFLSIQPTAVTIGLAYQQSLVEPKLPQEDHDMALNYIVTDKRIYNT